MFRFFSIQKSKKKFISSALIVIRLILTNFYFRVPIKMSKHVKRTNIQTNTLDLWITICDWYQWSFDSYASSRFLWFSSHWKKEIIINDHGRKHKILSLSLLFFHVIISPFVLSAPFLSLSFRLGRKWIILFWLIIKEPNINVMYSITHISLSVHSL